MSEFLDHLTCTARAGDGGNGCVSFRREKYVPKGGPNGGNGGRGGDIILVAASRRTTLSHIRPNCTMRSGRGTHGSGNNRTGASGTDFTMEVPVGTIVREASTGCVLADLNEEGQQVIVAEGGRGGLGNAAYAGPTNRAPREAQPGGQGEERELDLELKLLADVGIIGLPNAGKSTLTARISSARPKVAAYPFTTLVPVLGVVECGYDSFVIADIPGLIEGAHEGVGLGDRFLRHIERTRVLLHLVDVGSPDAPDPEQGVEAINRELSLFHPGLSSRPQLIAGNKIDLSPAPERLEGLRRVAAGLDIPFCAVSAATGEGIPEMLAEITKLLDRTGEQEIAEGTFKAGGIA